MNPSHQNIRREFESIAKAAARVDVSPRTIRRWIAAGGLAGYRLGPRLLRVDPNEVDAMLPPIPTAAHPMRSTDPMR